MRWIEMTQEKTKVYRVKGSFGRGSDKQVFTIDVIAPKPEAAKERIYTTIGSKHSIKRHLIKIDSIDVIKPEESKSLLVRQLMGVN